MNVFELAGTIALQGGKEVKEELSGIEGFAQKNSTALKALGGAFTAVGGATLKMVSDARELNAQLSQTGLTIGASTEEMRKLALETTNVTFPLESVVATFDLLARAGVESTDEMQRVANAFDGLADATGSSAEQVASILIPAFKSFGEQLPQNTNDLDKFTFLTKNTTVSLDEFGSVMNYVAAYGQDLNLTSTDLVATLAALEDRGIKGSAATKVFRTAITEASTEGKSLNEVLGISQQEIDGYKVKLEGASGITQQYADVSEQQFSVMDRVKQKFSELSLSLGSVLTPMEPLMAAMTAIGPIMIAASTATGAHTLAVLANAAAHPIATASLIAHKVATAASTVATYAAAAAQWVLNAALSANPIGIVIMAITALVAAGVALAKNWDTVSLQFKIIWDTIKIAFATATDWIVKYTIEPFIKVISGFLEGVGKIVGVFNKDWGEAIQGAADSVSGFTDKIHENTEQIKKDAEEHKQMLKDQKRALKETTDKGKEDIEGYTKDVDKSLDKSQGDFEDYAKGVGTEVGKINTTYTDNWARLDGYTKDVDKSLDKSADDYGDYATDVGTELDKVNKTWEDHKLNIDRETDLIGISLEELLGKYEDLRIKQEDDIAGMIDSQIDLRVKSGQDIDQIKRFLDELGIAWDETSQRSAGVTGDIIADLERASRVTGIEIKELIENWDEYKRSIETATGESITNINDLILALESIPEEERTKIITEYETIGKPPSPNPPSPTPPGPTPPGPTPPGPTPPGPTPPTPTKPTPIPGGEIISPEGTEACVGNTLYRWNPKTGQWDFIENNSPWCTGEINKGTHYECRGNDLWYVTYDISQNKEETLMQRNYAGCGGTEAYSSIGQYGSFSTVLPPEGLKAGVPNPQGTPSSMNLPAIKRPTSYAYHYCRGTDLYIHSHRQSTGELKQDELVQADYIGCGGTLPYERTIHGVTWTETSPPSQIAPYMYQTESGEYLWMSKGGIVTRPTLAMLAEKGTPEAVIPLPKMSDLSTVYNFVIENLAVHDKEEAERIARELFRLIQQKEVLRGIR